MSDSKEIHTSALSPTLAPMPAHHHNLLTRRCSATSNPCGILRENMDKEKLLAQHTQPGLWVS